MAVWLSAVSIGAGYCFGAIVGLVFYERHREVRRKKRAKAALGSDSVLQASWFMAYREGNSIFSR